MNYRTKGRGQGSFLFIAGGSETQVTTWDDSWCQNRMDFRTSVRIGKLVRKHPVSGVGKKNHISGRGKQWGTLNYLSVSLHTFIAFWRKKKTNPHRRTSLGWEEQRELQGRNSHPQMCRLNILPFPYTQSSHLRWGKWVNTVHRSLHRKDIGDGQVSLFCW